MSTPLVGALTVDAPRIDRRFVTTDGNLTDTAYALLFKLMRRTGGVGGLSMDELFDLILSAIATSTQPAAHFDTQPDVVQMPWRTEDLLAISQPSQRELVFPEVAHSPVSHVPSEMTMQPYNFASEFDAITARLPFVTLEQFGAVGNGIADDTAAWQAAIASGRSVLGRGGATYKVTAGATLTTPYQIIDLGNATLLPVGSFDAITLGGLGPILKNMIVDAAGLTGKVVTAPAGIQKIVMTDVMMLNGDQGIYTCDIWTSVFTRVHVLYFTGPPVIITSAIPGTPTNSLWFQNCNFDGNTYVGDTLSITKAAGIWVSGCSFQANVANSNDIGIDDVNQIVIDNGYHEMFSSGGACIRVGDTAAVYGLRIENNYTQSNKRSITLGSFVDAASTVITGNVFQWGGVLAGYAVTAPAGVTPEIHSNSGSMGDFDRSYTPSLTFGGAAVGMTYGATRAGRWQRLGNVMQVWFELLLTAKGASVGAAAVSLPNTSLAASLDGDARVSSWAAMGLLGNGLWGAVPGGSAAISLITGGVAATALVTDLNFTNASAIYGTATYEV